MNISTLLACIGLCSYSLTLLICISMIILISTRLRPLKSNISVLLTLNTYFDALVLSSMMLLMYFYNLQGNLDGSAEFGGSWCTIRTYLTYVCFCLYYYSFVFQATFRLCRIIFHRYKFLQTFRVFVYSLLVQWILSFLFILPNLVLDDFQYIPKEYNCWIAFENFRGLILVMIVIYNNPLSIIFTMYTLIIRYTRRTDQTVRRITSNRRDLLILKRIVVLVCLIIAIGLPSAAIVIIYLAVQYIVPYAYHIQGISISFGVLTGSISMVFITPQIQQVFRRNLSEVRPHQTVLVRVDRRKINPARKVNGVNSK